MLLLNRHKFGIFILQCLPQFFTFQATFCEQTSFKSAQQPSWKIAQSTHKPVDYNGLELKKLANLNDFKRINGYLDNILIHRPAGSENLKKVGLYIKRTLENLGYQVVFDKFSQNTIVGDRTFRNIIATLDPLAPRRLVLACHYDSKDFRPHFEFLGATDSAVPCALMLDVAESLHNYITNRSSPADLTLQLIFFDGEEAFRDWTPTDSLYGSRHLAELWEHQPYPAYNFYGTTELDRIDVFVLLDLLGAFKPVIMNYKETNYRPVYQALADTERQLKQTSGCLNSLQSIFGTADTMVGVDDDHAPFHKRGVNIVHVIPIPFPQVWHRRQDDRSALHQQTIENLATIFRVFTARYLGIRL